MDQQPQPARLVLDTRVDGSVGFTARSVLPAMHGSRKENGGRIPLLPIAGSKDWLSSLVEVGRQEVRDTDSYLQQGGEHGQTTCTMEISNSQWCSTLALHAKF